MKIAKSIIFSIFALMFINTGLNKFFNYIPVPEGLPEELLRDNAAFKEISWLMPLIATVEIIGGLLILILRTRALGALMVFPILVGVLLSHLTVAPEGLPMVFAFWAVLIWILGDNWGRLRPIIS
jgi:uncharacterized membrane protein YphA (DoxX/SURF4 family)